MDDDASCELVRVIAGCGWAVHALVFEFSDGKRYGTIQSNGCTAMPLTDASIAERCWTTIDIAPGDAIVRAEGHGLRDCPDYLCWGVSLLMSSACSFMTLHIWSKLEAEIMWHLRSTCHVIGV